MKNTECNCLGLSETAKGNHLQLMNEIAVVLLKPSNVLHGHSSRNNIF